MNAHAARLEYLVTRLNTSKHIYAPAIYQPDPDFRRHACWLSSSFLMSQDGCCCGTVSRPELGMAPGAEKLGEEKKKKDEKGAGFKWSSLAHGSHERSLPTEETWTHTHTLRLRQAWKHAPMSYSRQNAETEKQKFFIWWLARLRTRADGTGTCMCMGVHDFCQFYPLPCLSCLSTHSTYVSCSSSHQFLVPNLPRHLIFCCVISTSYNTWVACLFGSFVLNLSRMWCNYLHKHACFYSVANLSSNGFSFFVCFPVFFHCPVSPSRVGVLGMKLKQGLGRTKFTHTIWSLIWRKMTLDPLSLSNRPRMITWTRGATQTLRKLQV